MVSAVISSCATVAPEGLSASLPICLATWSKRLRMSVTSPRGRGRRCRSAPGPGPAALAAAGAAAGGVGFLLAERAAVEGLPAGVEVAAHVVGQVAQGGVEHGAGELGGTIGVDAVELCGDQG